MANHKRKLECHARRKKRHEDKRRQKREEFRAYSKPMPKSQRRTVQFPTIWNMPVKAWNRGKAAA